MKRQFSACHNHRSMYPSIFNSFTVIRTASAKNRRFHVPQPTFLFPQETPLRLSRKKTTQCLPNTRSMYLSIFNSYTMLKSMRKSKNLYFHVPQPTFLFPLMTPLRLSRNMLHGWIDNSMLAKPLAACTYLSSIVSELYDA